MKLRILSWIFLVFAAAFVLLSAESYLLQRSIADKTLRLHVVANSDSEEDQAQKLRVRDCVIQTVSHLTQSCQTAHEAQTMLAENLQQIEYAAAELLRSEASTYSISVSVGDEYFDTREYDTFTLPAGKYPALRVRIGKAEGKNWWCVVFPSLCTAATSEAAQECAEVGGYDTAESSLITGGEQKYVFRFKALEWLYQIFH